MKHLLLSSPSNRTLKIIIITALVVGLGFAGAVSTCGKLPHEGNIVAFELARTPKQVDNLFNAWGDDGKAARISILLDFGLIASYVTGAAGLLVAIARWTSGPWQYLGLCLVPLAVIAGLLDVVENLSLLRILRAGLPAAEAPVQVAWLCASVKFGLLGLLLIYAVLVAGLKVIGCLMER